MWSPGRGGGSVNASYDQPSYRQGHTGDISSHQHISAPQHAPGIQQFSTESDYGGHAGQDRGAPWQARDGGGGTWNQSHHGPSAASSDHHQHPQQQQQRGQTQAQREYGNQGHLAKTHVWLHKQKFHCCVYFSTMKNFNVLAISEVKAGLWLLTVWQSDFYRRLSFVVIVKTKISGVIDTTQGLDLSRWGFDPQDR